MKLDSNDRIGLLHSLASNLVEQWNSDGLFRTCLNCSYWQQNPQNEYQYKCEKHNQIPPPRILVAGCEQHSNLIPF